jgi:adenine phosphoribosyltransferase
MDFKSLIRDVPDFPKSGIMFKDITPLLKDNIAFNAVIRELSKPFKEVKIDQVLGIESRGFILAPAIALKLVCGFVPVRKPGKLPADTLKQSYALEYGTDSVEIHRDALSKGKNLLLVDDVLATGGTMEATCRLVEKLGGTIVATCFLLELAFLNGRAKLEPYPVETLLRY